MSLTKTPRDERLALLLEDLLQQQSRGAAIDFAALARQHPDVADELKQLLVVGQFVDGMARSGGDAAATVAPSADGPSASLPREFGAYQLVQEIGRGAMGVVYKAWDRELKRFV